jgi:hypothetical protein
MKNAISLLSLLLALIWLSSCNSESEPTVQTLDASNITGTEATTGGTVSEDGGAEVIGRGVCYNTLPQPNLNNSFTTDGAGLGSFASTLTDLEPNTQYYVRAYATNSVGTAYGNEITFTTADEPKEVVPTLSTLEITDITGTSASSGGTISDDGGSAITARGICWSTLPEPNINNETTSNGTGNGSFTSELTGLERNTKYYVRAYATNANGTGYGNELEFTTSSSIEITVNGKTYMLHEDAVYSSAWGPPSTTGATSVTSGQTNTETVSKLSGASAAKKCAESNVGGYDDWYLPAIQEIYDLFEADKEIIPTGTSLTWSSTEITDESASGFYIEDGTAYSYDYYKADVNNCFCVRIKE